MKPSQVVAGIIVSLVIQGPAFALSLEVENGLKHMKAKNYGLAARYFHKAAEKQPHDAITRYHLANSLVYLNRHEDAMNEYRRSYELDPYSIVSGYCRKALISYKTALPSTSSGYSLRTVNDTGGEKVRARSVASAPTENSGAVNMIRRQLANEKVRHHRYASSLSENVKKAGDVKAKTIKQDAEEKIRLLYEYGPLLPAGSGYKRTGVSYQALTPYQQKMVDNEVAEIRRQAEDDIKAEHSVANDRSRRIIKWSEERKESLNSVAENLESQLSETSSPSGVKLAPVGTGLYVRNYEATKTKRKLPDTRYSVARFVDKLDQNVEEENLDDIEIDTEENVRGSVVNFLSQKNSDQR